ncbi:MAG: pyruvate:ferredoxin (flavodoxin) oxidoreductase [Elusimicrobiota bacterium]
MNKTNMLTKPMDANEAAANVAYSLSQVIAIYPITPATPMGELSDAWAAAGRPNIWDTVPQVIEMQAEGGAAGAVHGSLTAGASTTTFTASQGLLLMMPNMYKLAGELTPCVIHVAARSVATQALSIFGDHSDVMAARQTGFAMLCSNSVQEAHDCAMLSHAATLETRVPFLHFFDGFRTSHEIQKVAVLGTEEMKAMIDQKALLAFRKLGLDPERPSMRGTAQNPDVFFQSREAINPFYLACADTVQKVMDRFAAQTGRAYKLFDYVGAPDAERVIVMMGSGCGAAEEAVEHLVKKGEKVGLVKVRLYRPFSSKHLVEALPAGVKRVAVLDRTKEPGGVGEPLFLDVVGALDDQANAVFKKFKDGAPKISGGRYGLSSKEFSPAMVKGIFDELSKDAPKKHFTVGINDDVTKLSLKWDPAFNTEHKDTYRALFYGLGSDGTVGANKNSIKMIAEGTNLNTQGYFVYDSKKSGSKTTSHLRFGPHPISSTYLITQANFIACHQELFLNSVPMIERAAQGATFLLNSTVPADKVWDSLPKNVQQGLIEKKMKFYVVDAYKVAREAGLGGLTNTVMQTCFFELVDLLPDAIKAIKDAIEKTYGKKSSEVVKKNFAAVDQAIANMTEVKVPEKVTSELVPEPPIPEEAPDFVKKVTGEIVAGRGDLLPVSAFPVDGTYPTGTTKWEKRNLAMEIPIWDKALCIQCNKCSMVCPHAAIRVKAYPKDALKGAPEGYKSVDWRGKEFPQGTQYTVQVAPEDCTGCGVCVEVCPAKNKKEEGRKAINMEEQKPHRDQEAGWFKFFLDRPEADRSLVPVGTVKGSQLLQPLFEFSGACAGCGETPYLKLLTQLYGDRLAVANATGCSSIYGGNLPTTPWADGKDGRGPAWSNSLFEDNAEFGLGFRLAYSNKKRYAEGLIERHKGELPGDLAKGLLEATQRSEADIVAQRKRVKELKDKLKSSKEVWAQELVSVSDSLIRKSVWAVGGDGWAYDIGYGGLDHVIASGEDINILVLDTECYANTGGQASKATPRAAVAKFASAGKKLARKDLTWAAMGYGTVYVARVAMGANDTQTVKAFVEAESYPGPSLIVAYSHCIEHGFPMSQGMQQQKLAVDSGYWPLFRYDPRLADEGKNPLQLDSKKAKIPLIDYVYTESRYKRLTKDHPDEAKRLLELAQQDVDKRWKMIEELAQK